MVTQTETTQAGVAGQRWGLLGALTILILILFFAVALCPIAPNLGFASAAAVLSMIAAIAVGIERIIEGFWTIIGMTKGAFWPLNLISEQVDGMVNDLDSKLKPVYDAASAQIGALENAGELVGEQLAEAKKELNELKARTERLKALAPDNQRVNMIAASAFQGISFLEKKYPQVVEKAKIANQAIVGVSDFVATFKDNPGRRLISILLGMILGLSIAGVVRLDVFQAASQPQPSATPTPTPTSTPTPSAATGGTTSTVLAQVAAGQTAPAGQGASAERKDEKKFLGVTVGSLWPFWGVALTGLLMGLGSNPTHEVIRAIQEVKKARKSDNDPAPVTGQTIAGGVNVAGVVEPSTVEGVNTYSLRRRS